MCNVTLARHVTGGHQSKSMAQFLKAYNGICFEIAIRMSSSVPMWGPRASIGGLEADEHESGHGPNFSAAEFTPFCKITEVRQYRNNKMSIEKRIF